MKRPAITDRTRENILQAFWGLYQVKSIHQISIRALMEAAGYHRSTFYQYFETIYDVQRALEDQVLEDIRTVLVQAVGCREAALEQAALDGIAQAYRRNGHTMAVLLGEHGDPGFPRRLKAMLYPILQEGLALPDTPKTPYILEYISSVILHQYSLWWERGGDLPLGELIPLIRTLVFSGLGGVAEAGKMNGA